MRKLIFLLSLIFCVNHAHASICQTLSGSPSQTTLQTAINSCGNGNTLQLSAGTTTVTSSLNLACGVIVSGPVVPFVNGLTNPTATITTSAQINIFTQSGGCTSGATSGIEYLHLNGWQGYNFDGSNYTNIAIIGNTLTGLAPNNVSSPNPAAISWSCCGTISNITIENNTIGDSTSCTWTNSGINDNDGCGITFFAQCNTCVGIASNVTIRNNYFNHVAEGIHFFATGYTGSGPAASYCNNCDIEFNLFNQIHRIGIEFQINTVTNGLIESNNVFENPNNAYYESYAVSNACCIWGANDGSQTDPTVNPGASPWSNG